MIALIYDTETTGLPLFSEPSEDPRQPHIVQLAAALVDLDTRIVISSMDVTVRPDGWDIPDEVTAIHGITNEHARDVGVSESLAVDMFLDLWQGKRLRIAHNESFDARIVRIAMQRSKSDGGPLWEPDFWKAGKAECTQQLATPIMRLPPTEKMRAAGRNGFKTANLREAYKHFTGQEMVGAHNAMVNVQACMVVYLAIKNGLGRAA